MPEDKKEVLFLPYKASMWDSLESVWKAADADPDCDAYVIPIPYFDKNPDGSFKEEHYEGDQYPKNVPITRYDEYDLEVRRPDVIYIHNPYDECNHVTSVHPYFYSKNLRNFTDKLVYIPYFVLGEIDPDDQAAIDGMKHFCFTPGTIYAHQVIVQSENMRQIYINEYIKAAKEMGLSGEHVDRKFLEKKFLGTGSPKIDKVLNTKKEDLEIPDEWLRVIEKPDGSWKKIVFYNTSVSALLQHGGQMIVKIKDSLKTFKENKEEVALLWRPHPLIKSTIESMRPELQVEYSQVVERYCREGWGIYDDSAELDRAVVLSDKYYGDISSVAQLYVKCNKPVLIQGAGFLGNHEKKINTHIEAGVVADNMIYYTIPRYNKFYCTDLNTGKTQCIDNTSGRRAAETDYFNHAASLGDYIFFFSDENYKCALLNPQTNEIKRSSLKLKRDDSLKYLGRYEQSIYFMNPDMTKVCAITDGKVKEFQIEEGTIFSTEGVFWHFEKENRRFWKINVLQKTRENFQSLIDEISLNRDQNIAFTIEKDNKLYIVADMTDKIFVYDLADKSVQRVSLPKSATCFLGGRGALRYIEGTNGKLYLSSMFSSEIFVWENEKLTEIGKTRVGVDDDSFYELHDDLYKQNPILELFIDLALYINL
ncbi:MAG: hypothetical protein K2K90_17925 [Lachnospiraceae bacterium]|nr:hypothetical protein [Lachnospiraceae bacterium]